jgi:hypothetical protein
VRTSSITQPEMRAFLSTLLVLLVAAGLGFLLGFWLGS